MGHDSQAELAFLGMAGSPGFVRESEGAMASPNAS
jgi:hypothetical protein